MTADTSAPPLPHRFTPGSVRAAFSYRPFRLIWTGMFLSNVGTWMQNVALPAYITARTGSAGTVGIMVFAQLGPILLLSIPAGVLAARFSRRGLLIASNAAQLVGSVVLAYLVSKDAAIASLFLANLFIGIAGAFGAPVYQASVPLLVDRRDLSGAIALNSTQLNGSRVIGPVIAAILTAAGFSISQLFLVNAATYLFMIAAVAITSFPPVVQRVAEQGWRQITTGLRIARERWILGRLLISMTVLSFFSLVVVGLFAPICKTNFGINPLSATYKWLYATWGVGACLGAISSGTVLAQVDKRRIIRPATIGMAVALIAFAAVSSTSLAFPISFVLGGFYFLMATAMTTVFQQEAADHERAYLMPLGSCRSAAPSPSAI
jgi:MFS family permease